MSRKLLSLAILVLATACSEPMNMSSDMGMDCCKKCECCQSMKKDGAKGECMKCLKNKVTPPAPKSEHKHH